MSLARTLHIEPGELRHVLWLGVVSVAFNAAITVGDEVATSVFVARSGYHKLPDVFFLGAILDLIAATLYLLAARGRSVALVWKAALVMYAGVVLAIWLAASDGGRAGTYALYVVHTTASTILTLHWGLFILDAFDASQARRLFPFLFAVGRLGAMAGAGTVAALSSSVGATNLLVASCGLAGVAAALSQLGRVRGRAQATSFVQRPDASAADEEEPVTTSSPLTAWRQALQSPLVRTIAVSVAAMVLVRHGLRMVSMGEISNALESDENLVAEFIGLVGMIGNCAAITLGLLLSPRLIARFGAGAVNTAYAAATLIGFVAVWVIPSLFTAALARFSERELKVAIRNPLAALFYGAEPPPRRASGRALIFGVVIPTASVIAAVAFKVLARWEHALALTGTVMATLFTISCVIQARRWRVRLAELLRWKLTRTSERVDSERLAGVASLLERRGVPERPAAGVARDDLCRGLASANPRLRAAAEELLTEVIPRATAHQIRTELRTTVAPP